nr:GAF domain-containing protein [Pseudonocardia sp. C8]
MTVGFAAEYVGPERSRSCFYGLEDDPETGGRTLRLRAWHGRNKPPRARFDPADPAEAQVFALVDSLDSMIVTDVQAIHLLGWTDIAEYRTFIAVTVAAGERPLGLLTLDSLHPGDLSDEDLDLVRLFAQLLAAGLSVR